MDLVFFPSISIFNIEFVWGFSFITRILIGIDIEKILTGLKLLSQLLYTEFLALPTSIRGSCNEELNEN
jgi:hypothetical protein